MIKKLILAAIVAAPMMLSAQTAAKFGYINPDAILAVMPDMTTADNTLKTAQQKYTTQITALQTELQKKSDELDALAKNPSANKATLEAKQKEAQELYTKYQNFLQTAQDDLAKQEQTLKAPIIQKLSDTIKQVGAEGGYTAIFTEGAMLYHGSNLEDIAPKVKTKLGIK